MSKYINKLTFLGLLCVAMTSYSAVATELIDQEKVMASGGFPFKIKRPGRYRPGSNLIVTGGRDGIYVEASRVTDLDGFAMIADTDAQFVPTSTLQVAMVAP